MPWQRHAAWHPVSEGALMSTAKRHGLSARVLRCCNGAAAAVRPLVVREKRVIRQRAETNTHAGCLASGVAATIDTRCSATVRAPYTSELYIKTQFTSNTNI